MRNFSGYRSGLVQEGQAFSTWKVEALKQISYQIRVSDDIFDSENTVLLDGCDNAPMRAGDRRLIVMDESVDELYGTKIRAWFQTQGVSATIRTMRADETVKQWESVEFVLQAMSEFNINRRREPVIAIGGGVLLDIVGMAASIYRRGTPFVRIPTTLIGLVDAGVGVKTGVNYGGSKNRIGTYAPALATYVDRTFLTSLPERHMANGMAEVLKMALIRSRKLFDLLEADGRQVIQDRMQPHRASSAASLQIISEAIHLMLEELQPNLWESCLERCVDYGHTFSPTIEMEALPSLLHGEAVCIDMAMTTMLGERRGYLSGTESRRIIQTMHTLGLPTWHTVLDQDGVLNDALADTVRHRDGLQRLPLPRGIGAHTFVNDVTPDELTAALLALHDNSAQGVKAYT